MANSKQQKEYNDLLGLTSSLVGKISKSMDDLGKQSDKRNKALQDETKLYQTIVGSIKDEVSAQKALNELKQREKEISKTNYGINEKDKINLLIRNKAAQDGINKSIQGNKVFDAVQDAVNDNMQKGVDKVDELSNKLGNIPIVGKGLQNIFKPFADDAKKSIGVAGERFTTFFKMKYNRVLKEGGTSQQALLGGLRVGLKGSMTALKGVTGAAKRFLAALGPIGIIAGIIAAGFMIGLKAFKELDSAGKTFRENTGLLVSQTGTLNRNIASTRVEFANLGVSAEDVAKAAADFTNEFDGIEKPARNVLGSMVMLNKNFGIGTAEASKLNKVFQNIGGLSAEQSQFLIGQTAEIAKMAGVAPQKVIKDMADSSEYAYKYFKGSPQELQKAAVQAAKMGTSIAEAGKAADNLLDFQNSITKELEASAILGTNLNFSQARYAAANGDLIGQQQAINDQVAKLGDLTKLNVYEQQALADASGMEFSSLVNQQRIRERFGKLGKEQLAAALALADAGKDISQINATDLKNQTARMKSQQEMASIMEKFKNETGAIGTALGDAFRPIAEFIMPIFTDIASILGKVLVPAFQLIGKALSIVFGILKPIFSFILAVVGGIVGLFGSVIEVFVNGFGFVADVIGQIGDYIEKYIISPIRSFFDGIGSFISTLGGLFGFGGSSESASEGVNDGVISPDGDIISTNPSDFLLATKNPAGLAQEVSAGGGVDMSGVIAQLQRLETAFRENKDFVVGKEALGAVVTDAQERSGRKNNFGVGVA